MSHNRRQTRSLCERRLDHHPRCDRPAAHCAACGRTCGWDVDIAGNVRPAAAGSALWPAPNPMSDVLTGGGWQTLHWLLLLAALWLAIGVVGLFALLRFDVVARVRFLPGGGVALVVRRVGATAT